jgi:hypothetical protein
MPTKTVSQGFRMITVRRTKEKGTESPWAQRWIIIDVDNVSKNIFGIVEDSSLSEMIFLGSIEDGRFVPDVIDLRIAVVGLLGIESRSLCHAIALANGHICRRSHETWSLGCHDEKSERQTQYREGCKKKIVAI